MKLGYGIGVVLDQSFKSKVDLLKKHGAASVFIDDYSLAKSIDDREQMKFLLSEINQDDEVLIPNLSTFALNGLELVRLLEIFSTKKVKLNFIEDELLIGGLGIAYEAALSMYRAAVVLYAHSVISNEAQGAVSLAKTMSKGRKVILTKAQKIEVMEKFHLYDIKLKQLELEYKVSRTTLWRAINCDTIEIERNNVLIRKNILESEKLKEKQELILNR